MKDDQIVTTDETREKDETDEEIAQI